MRNLLIITALTLMPCLASATIVRTVTLDQMTHDADAIVYGKVVKQESTWNDAKTRIYTLTTVRVFEDWKTKGKSAQMVTIRQIGGSVGGLTQAVVGNAKLSVDEEVVIFLERSHDGRVHFVIGMAQGKFTVRNTGDAKTIARRPLEGLKLVNPQQPRIVPSAQPKMERVIQSERSLQIFRDEVKQILAP